MSFDVEVMQDALPNEAQKRELCMLIQSAFVEIRSLGWAGEAKQAADLADAFHNVSMEMHGWGSFSWEITRGMFADYQSKYAGRRNGRDYVAELDRIRNIESGE